MDINDEHISDLVECQSDDLSAVIETLDEDMKSASPSEREMDKVEEELADTSLEAKSILREIERLRRRSTGLTHATIVLGSGLSAMTSAKDHVKQVRHSTTPVHGRSRAWAALLHGHMQTASQSPASTRVRSTSAPRSTPPPWTRAQSCEACQAFAKLHEMWPAIVSIHVCHTGGISSLGMHQLGLRKWQRRSCSTN